MFQLKLKHTLIAGAVLSVLGFSHVVVAQEKPASGKTTYFEVLARAQVELVDASGDIPRGTDENGFHVTDAWGAGNPNSHNWSGLFFDAGHKLTSDLEVFGRYAFNFNMDGLPDGRAKYRDVFIGLRGDFGAVRVGRLESPYKLAGLGWDPLNATSFQARQNMGRSAGALGHGGYHNDSIDYSVSLNDVRLQVFYSKGDGGPSGSDQNSMYAAAVTVPVGNLELLLSHFDADNRGAGKRDGTKLGARYKMGPWLFAGQYEFRGTGLENGDYLFLSTAYQAAMGQFSLNYGRFMDDSPLNNDGEYIAAGLMRRLSPHFAYHVGMRYTDRDQVGSETLVGVGFRFSWQHKAWW